MIPHETKQVITSRTYCVISQALNCSRADKLLFCELPLTFSKPVLRTIPVANMALSGFLFLSFRIAQLLTLIPIVGMLAWFVHGFVVNNQLTPTYILLLFITSVLAAAWTLATLVTYLRARHSALFVALVDLAFVGTLIAAVYELRAITNQDCAHFSSGSIYLSLGPFGYYGRQSGSQWALHINKTCAMLKACFALAIINIIFFFFTFVSCSSIYSLLSNY